MIGRLLERVGGSALAAVPAVTALVAWAALIVLRPWGEAQMPVAEVFEQRTISLGELPPLEGFELLDQAGAPFGPERFQGQWSVVFPGFTSCGHVCPTTMALLADYLDRVPSRAHPQIIFLTVDPGRDDVAAVARYVARFHPSILGVTGTAGALKDLREQLQAGATRTASGTFDHSTALYVVAPDGQPTGAVLTYSSAEVIASELDSIIREYADARGG